MCRIAGIKYFRNQKVDKSVLINMRDSLEHGGPDSANIYINQESNLGFGHRRLSILDLSADGDQPMHYRDSVLVFNGELYNFMEVRQELVGLGYTFSTGTDTEVLLKAFEKWGIDCIERFRGMFAFALYDRKNNKLILARDRVGVKPLFVYEKDGVVLFASELKAFHEHPSFDKTINKEALSLYLQQGYITSPHCVFKYVRKLNPGEVITYNAQGDRTEHRYWDVKKHYPNGKMTPRSEEQQTEELEEILRNSFNYRMVSDVPVGSFLSGGIDSSLVTAMVQKESNSQLKTFTIGFEDPKYNEANHAKKISEHIGTDHHELYVKEDDFLSVLDKFSEIYDEPFGDSSGIPTYLLSKMTSEHVKVSLSADGGDEIFGGYTKYESTKKIYNWKASKSKIIQKSARLALNSLAPETVNKYLGQLPILNRYTNLGVKMHKLKHAFDGDSFLDVFNRSSVFLSEAELMELFPLHIERYDIPFSYSGDHMISYLGMVDIETYLEGDIMTKVDRATMQHGLEGRDPMLDHNVIEFGMGLSDDLKIKNDKAKYLLRKILYKYVPQDLIDRPKQGFAVPIRKWLLQELKEELVAMKNDASFFSFYEMNHKVAEKRINEFVNQSGYQNEYNIWFLYVLYKWHLRWMT